ncbi:MAG TPA: host-nuclease inhibitor Gam family protein [Steroidobacteraceae bacterium]|nr:host-nuclease inhibitor Gam family protein [Steroidobacteraceae bacterium]
MSLDTLEQLTKEHAADRALIAERVAALNEEMQAAQRRKLPGIKAAVSKAKDSHARLQAAIDSERDLFNKPRSRVFHGIRIGLQKAKGKLTFEDAAQVVKLIRKHFAEQFDVLVKTTEKPVKDALLQMPAADLKRIGCSVTDVGDVVLIKPTDSEIDKLVDALLAEKQEGTEDDER